MSEELKSRLTSLGLTEEQINTLVEKTGVADVSDMAFVTEADLLGAGIKAVPARKIVAAFVPVLAAPVSTSPVDAEIPVGADPSKDQVTAFANQFGTNPNILEMFLMGNLLQSGLGGADGGVMDLSSILPIEQAVGAYSPRKRDMYYLVMAQLERQLVDRSAGEGIVVINPDGSINRELTIKHIRNLDLENEQYPVDGLFYDDSDTPYEIISVGADAQSYGDEDPLDPGHVLGQNRRGTGNISYRGVSLEVRQMLRIAYELGEITEPNLTWLRHNLKAGTTTRDLSLEFPKAIAKFNELSRGNNLPNLRVMKKITPRRNTGMPNRRKLKDRPTEGLPGSGSGFPFDDDR